MTTMWLLILYGLSGVIIVNLWHINKQLEKEIEELKQRNQRLITRIDILENNKPSETK